MKQIIALLLCVCCLSACTMAVPLYHHLAATDKPEIAVRIFDTRGAEGGYTGGTDFGKMIAEFTAGFLQQSHYKAVVISNDSDASGFRYIVEGELSQIEPGSWAKRFWVGCGAGSARMTVLVKYVRASDKTELGSAKFSTSSLTTHGQESSLRRISANLANKIFEKCTEIIRQDKQGSEKKD